MDTDKEWKAERERENFVVFAEIREDLLRNFRADRFHRLREFVI